MRFLSLVILLLASSIATADHTFWVTVDWSDALDEEPLASLPANGNVTPAVVVKTYANPPTTIVKEQTVSLISGGVSFPFVLGDNLQTVDVKVVSHSGNFAVARHGPVHHPDQLPWGNFTVELTNWQSTFGRLQEFVSEWVRWWVGTEGTNGE